MRLTIQFLNKSALQSKDLDNTMLGTIVKISPIWSYNLKTALSRMLPSLPKFKHSIYKTLCLPQLGELKYLWYRKQSDFHLSDNHIKCEIMGPFGPSFLVITFLKTKSTSGCPNCKQSLCKTSCKGFSSSWKELHRFVDLNIWREDVELKIPLVSLYLTLFYSLVILFADSWIVLVLKKKKRYMCGPWYTSLEQRWST